MNQLAPRKVRNSNIELLRIISMLFIILNHYALRGGFTFESPMQFNSILVYWFHLAGKIAVNVFILISGYFLCTSKGANPKKVVRLLMQVLFYCCILIIAGWIIGTVGKKQTIRLLFAVPYNYFSFVTYYMIMYMLSPWVNKLLASITDKSLLILWGIMTTIWVVIPTLFNSVFYVFFDMNMTFGSTYGPFWFLYMYLTAAVIRRREDHLGHEPKKYLLTAGGLIVFIMLAEVLLIFLSSKGVVAKGRIEYFREYNTFFNVLCAVCAFMGFKNLKMENRAWINKLASTSFGVFLIHANFSINKFLWITIFHTPDVQNSPFLFLHAIFVAIAVYALGSAVDLLRQKYIEPPVMKKLDAPIDRTVEKVDAWIDKVMQKNAE